MKKKIWLLVLFSIPVFMFANAYQAFRYIRQENTIQMLDREQRSLIEANKRAVTDISVLTSPRRVRSAAESDPRFRQGFPDQILYIQTREARSE